MKVYELNLVLIEDNSEEEKTNRVIRDYIKPSLSSGSSILYITDDVPSTELIKEYILDAKYDLVIIPEIPEKLKFFHTICLDIKDVVTFDEIALLSTRCTCLVIIK